MDEATWLSSADPAAMLEHLRRGNPSARKLRLFACACCYQVWDKLTDERSRRAVEVASRYADGEATEAQLRSAHRYLDLEAPHEPTWALAYAACELPDTTNHPDISRVRNSFIPAATQAALLRCVFGNPWRPAVLPYQRSDGHGHVPCPWLVWNNGTVPRLAAAIYAERRFADLPILADALEEAGCPAAEVCRRCDGTGRMEKNGSDHRCGDCWGDGRVPSPLLAHLRGPGPHCRGCWCLDILLGRE